MWLPRAATQGRPYKNPCPGLAVAMVATAKQKKMKKQSQFPKKPNHFKCITKNERLDT